MNAVEDLLFFKIGLECLVEKYAAIRYRKEEKDFFQGQAQYPKSANIPVIE
jgi:hypothetical protein